MSYIHLEPHFHSLAEGHARTLRIYTPTAYDEQPDRRFPVVYMNDGQNVFAHPASARFDTWCANTTMDRLVDEGAIEPWIIVAIDHGQNRFEEYTPWPEPRLNIQGRGDQYIRFVADELKPQIDAHYRTRPDAPSTAIMGSSLGGLVSLYAGLTRPEVFGRIGGVSPTVMWSLHRIFDAWRAHPRLWTRIWLDVGTGEDMFQQHIRLDYPRGVMAFYNHLKGLGYADHELRLFVENGGAHNEIDWQRRLPEVFRWLLA